MPFNQYISEDSYDYVLNDLSIDTTDTDKTQEILDRATGDIEADLARKFVVPLVATDGGAYSTCPAFAKNKMVNVIKAKLREIIGYDKNRNLTGTMGSTDTFINVHGVEYTKQIKEMLDQEIEYGFKLNSQSEGTKVPINPMVLARANNDADPTYIPEMLVP